MLQEYILHATPETPIHNPRTSQILCLYPPTSEKSWNKRDLVPCKITFEFQFYSVGIPRDLQSCTTSTNQRRKIKAKQEYIPAKELFGLLHCSSMQYLKRREIHLHLPHGNMAELWKRVLNLVASNPIMTGFPCQMKMNPEGQWIWTTCLCLIRSKSWCTILFP